MRFPGPTGVVTRSLARFARNAGRGNALGGNVERSVAAVSHLQAYCGALVRDRRRHPGDDLRQPDAPTARGSVALAEAEVFWFFLLLLLAGHETTTNLLGNLLLALIANPEECARSARTESRAVGGHEALRFESPIQGFFRTAKEPYRAGDVEIPRGGRVLVSLPPRTVIPSTILTRTPSSSAETRPITWDSAAASTSASELRSPRWRDARCSRSWFRARASSRPRAPSIGRRIRRSAA